MPWSNVGELGLIELFDLFPGDLWLLRHPEQMADRPLLEAMLDYAEGRWTGAPRYVLFVRDEDHTQAALAGERGCQQRPDAVEWDSELVLDTVSDSMIPAGFRLLSMAHEESDLALRARAFGLGFDHQDPADWPSPESYAELQRAPDYRPELDLVLQAPEGEYASFCIGWWDQVNRIGILEPVGTHPDYRRRGLARAVVTEAVRRLAELGAERVWVGAGLPFYESMGFVKRYPITPWVKRVRPEE